MNTEEKKDGGEDTTPDYEAKIAEMQEQIENLNKGVSSYRDENRTTKEALKAAQDQLAEVTKQKDASEDVELTAEDEKKFQAWANKNGIVTKQEMVQERERLQKESAASVMNTAVAEFLEKHPEYDDDDEWQKVNEEFKLYKTPTDLAGYKKLLNKIHKDLKGPESKEDARAKARAEINKRSSLTKGGKGQGAAGGSGDTESRIDEMQDKYPSLSREQIVTRLKEVDELYKDK